MLSIFSFPDPNNSELQYCSLESIRVSVSSLVVFLFKYGRTFLRLNNCAVVD